jgi:tetratricopeptide (TPR) repeat protein
MASASRTRPCSAMRPPRPPRRCTGLAFPQVLAYFGPVGDAQSTRIEAAIYRRLAEGQTARQAAREARIIASRPHHDVDGRAHCVYPLGWAQLALYLRGRDLPTATPGKAGGDEVLIDRHDRTLERIDPVVGQAAATPGVQRLKHGFVGRRAVRAELLRRWLGGQRLLVVTGLGGLGKTALCTEFLGRLAEKGARLLALDGRSAGQMLDPVAGLWRQVQAAAQGDPWNTALANLQRNGLGGAVLAAAVAALVERVGNLVLYLDDAESLQVSLGAGELGRWRDAELAAFWRGLSALTRPGGMVTVLASARYAPDDLPTEAHVSLPPMRDMDLVRLLRWFPTLGRLPAADVAWLAPRLDGHPRTVEWLDALAGERVKAQQPPSGPWTPRSWRTDVLEPVLPDVKVRIDADLLLPQVIVAAGVPAREHLGRCSLLQAPAPWGAVLAVEHETGTGRRLGALGLLSPYQPPGGDEPYWAPHRMVAEAVAAVWKALPQPAHAALGAFFARAFDEHRGAELAEGAVHHLLAAGQADAAWPVAHRLTLVLRNAGRDREALAQVQRVLAGEPTGETLGTCLTFQVQLELRAGVQSEDAVHPKKPWLERRKEDLSRAERLVALEGQNLVLHERANLFRHVGDLEGAAHVLERALAICTKAFGTEDHRDVAASLHQLAGVLHAQGDLDGAKKMLERALAIKAKVFGTEYHPDVAASLHALAGVLQAQGDLNGAKKRIERALAIDAKVFGTEDHPDIAASLHVLANVLQTQGDLDGAKKKIERALAISTKAFGTEDHPDVAASLYSIAGVLQAQGDLDGAKKKLEHALAIFAKVFGTEDHPDVAASLHTLAGVLRAQGDLDGAKKKLERALAIFAKVFGTEDHPDVAASLHALAGVLQDQGDLDGAIVLLERVLRIDRRAYRSRDHFSISITELSLAQLLATQGHRERAVELLQHALAVFTRQLPPGHTLTQQTQQILAGVMGGAIPGASR